MKTADFERFNESLLKEQRAQQADRLDAEMNTMRSILQEALPAWTFYWYGNAPALACFPPCGTGSLAWEELSRFAVISSACGPFYVVTQLNQSERGGK